MEQVNFLQVRSVPFGSTSHVDANGAIVPGRAVATISSPKKVSKREHESVSMTAQAPAEEEKSKKHKKEKKEKNDKKWILRFLCCPLDLCYIARFYIMDNVSCNWLFKSSKN